MKTAKAEAKSIEETINAQAKRLERSWSTQRQWTYENWQTYYYQHPLMRLLVEKLVWQMEVGETSTAFMVQGDTFINVQKEKMDIPTQATIRLWHPTDSPTADVLRWRNYLFDEKIKQPFKQAFREIYILTEAEENTFDHSNRFAAHVLRGNTLYSLGKTRGWTMSYDGAPYLKLPEAGLVAVLNISGRVLYDNCQTRELFFMKVDPNSKHWGYWGEEKLPLNEVPPVILSEVMRDVDLSVAVSSLGIDPYFNQNEEGELLNYWRNYSFGEKSRTAIAEVRKDLLERLIPMTKIAKQCSFEGNYLKVKGSLRTYKINLGSGNILMEPNDQYLCIVPAPNKKMEKKIWLPFEGGDKTLMIIISKAFLLAEDEKITESLIVSQINRR